MTGYVCTVAGGKGGVGKTTTAVNLGAALEAAGYETVVVDADLGMANLSELLGLDPEVTLHDLLGGQSTVSDALTGAPGGLTVVPGATALEAFADADPAKLPPVIKTLRSAFDVVLVDTGAGLSQEVATPMELADGVLLVTTPDDVALRDTEKTAALAWRAGASVLGVVCTRVTDEGDLEAVADRVDVPLLGGIPADRAATTEEPLVVHAPESTAGAAYEALGDAFVAVYRDGAAAADLDPVFDPVWVRDDEAAGDEEDDSEDVFGLFG